MLWKSATILRKYNLISQEEFKKIQWRIRNDIGVFT